MRKPAHLSASSLLPECLGPLGQNIRLADFSLNWRVTNPSWATQISVKASPSPEVEKPNIILSWCAGTVCWASHSSWKLLNKGLRCCALLRFVCVHCCFLGGPGFCCSPCPACPTWNATPPDSRLWKCSAAGKTALKAKNKSPVARTDAIMALSDIFDNKEKLPWREYLQVFARDNFQLFARCRGAAMLETHH